MRRGSLAASTISRGVRSRPMAEPRFSIIPADAEAYDESWKLELLASRPDHFDGVCADDDGSTDDGSGLVQLMQACGGRCWFCGCQMNYGNEGSSITREHLLPRARGGGNKADNIVGACRSCNVSKQAKTVEEFRAYRGVVAFYGEVSG
ncbi:MAG: HNH endonuclease [Hyphomicrobiales bacterium]|nr:MAG: HNH endonuclease [Hyphomicrobiales bacterium]